MRCLGVATQPPYRKQKELTTMSSHRIPATVASVLAAAVLTATPASASIAPEPGDPRAETSAVALAGTITALIEECRQTPSVAERRLIHAELILVRRDGA
jgi:hypothetical protein